MLLRAFLDLLFWAITKGGYGGLVGAIAGALSAVTVFLPSMVDLPAIMAGGPICAGYRGCDDLVGWLVIVALAGTLLGVVLGGLFGVAGRRLALRYWSENRAGVGTVVGGLIGGIAPWAILLILSLDRN